MEMNQKVFASDRPIVVLGGAGFIGTRLTDLLVKNGDHVRIGDLRTSSEFPQLTVTCDVRKKESLHNVLNGAKAIINLAAEHRDDVRPVSRYDETNVEGARQVCLAARAAGVQTIIFTSSVAVYGFHQTPTNETACCHPFNDYGRTKLEAEKVYHEWAEENPERTLVIIRPTVVFGEKNRGNVYNLLRQMASGVFLMVGNGKNYKSMAYVGNVAAFLAFCLHAKPGIHTYNYVDGPDMSTQELVNWINRCFQRKGIKLHIPEWLALGGGYLFDVVARLTNRTFPISSIRIRKFCASTQFTAERVALLGFVPHYTLQQGLENTIQAEFRAKK